MTTLAIMKARIADELMRSDLTSQIAYAITDAIASYEGEFFWFNESRSNTVATVANQEFYGSGDASWIASVVKVDYAKLVVGNNVFTLSPSEPAVIEVASTNGTATGQPDTFCWYADQIRLYPVPTSAWTLRVGAKMKMAAPAADDTANNVWMTHAERLIRSHAKQELYLHVLKDPENAQTMGFAAEGALEKLRDRTTSLMAMGGGRVRPMDF